MLHKGLIFVLQWHTMAVVIQRSGGKRSKTFWEGPRPLFFNFSDNSLLSTPIPKSQFAPLMWAIKEPKHQGSFIEKKLFQSPLNFYSIDYF